MKRISLLLLFISFAGCASQTYLTLDIEPVSGHSESIIETARQVEALNLFPDNVYKKMNAISAKEKDLDQKLTEIQGSICDGNKPRFIPRYSVTYVAPKIPEGVPLDQASKSLSDFGRFIQIFMKERFFDEASKFNETENTDFIDYKKYYIETAGQRKFVNRWRVHVPYLYVAGKKEIAEYYSQLNFSPLLPNMALPVDEWIFSKYALVLTGKKSAVIVPKVAGLLKISYSGLAPEIELANYYLGELDAPNPATVYNLEHHMFYQPTEKGWKTKEEKIYPLKLSYFTDLAVLRRFFVMLFDQSTQDQSIGRMIDGNYWGYRDSQLSMTEALSVQDIVWRKYLAYATTVKELATESGANFTLELDLSLFCQHGVNISGIKSQ